MSNIAEVRQSIINLGPQIKAVLPDHVPVEKFTRVVLTAINQNPDLVVADKNSLFASCLKAAQDSLLPDGREAALVTFKNKSGGVTVQYMPMISGILKKVRQSGELKNISAQLIYKNDKFKYHVDSDGEHLTHEPDFFSERGNLIGAYAIAKTKDDAIYIEIMTMKEIESVRESSRSKNFGPWAGNFYTEMVKKTVIRRLSKRLPMSTDVETVIKRDDELYEFQDQQKTEEPKKQLKIKDKLLGVKKNVEATNNEGSSSTIETKSENTGRLETSEQGSKVQESI